MKFITPLLTTTTTLFLFFTAFANTSVFYGKDAPRTPYMAKLRIHAAEGAYACGSVLIHPEWALTAAHCINPVDIGRIWWIEVFVGEYDTTIHDGERSIDVTSIYTFGYQWESPSWNEDIALLHLAETLTRTYLLTETIIDFIPLSHTQPMTGAQLSFYGWGVQEEGGPLATVLQVGVMTIGGFDGFIHTVGTQYSGGGDSGGPGIISGTLEVAGILVNGSDNYTGFVNVADFADEIEQVIATQTRPPVRKVYLPLVYGE